MPNDWRTNARPVSPHQHPNIADLRPGTADATAALVMALPRADAADGTRGAIPTDEARPIAKQIAEALDAADNPASNLTRR
jgi:hypothetical protein